MIATALRPQLLLDGLGLILDANAGAEGALHRGDVIRRARDGKLVLCDAETHDRFRRKLEIVAAGGHAAGAESVVSPPGGKPFRLRLRPAPLGLAASAPQLPEPARILAALHDPGLQAAFAVDDIRDAFGLTMAEVRVAIAVADGRSLGSIARAREGSIATVRNQLKIVLSKTGCTRQAELAALLRHFIDE
jgi:DNA-binding CsgD family transcriptional regulator